MNLNKSDKGFGALAIILIALAILLSVTQGYFIWSRNRNAQNISTADTEVTNKIQQDSTNTLKCVTEEEKKFCDSISTGGLRCVTDEEIKNCDLLTQRDKERKEDLEAIAAQLEIFYGKSKRYPTQEELLSKAWRDQNGFKLTDDQVRDPLASPGEVSLYAVDSSRIVPKGKFYYTYYPIYGVGNYCFNTKEACTSYELVVNGERSVIDIKSKY